jgi:[protein-PII] uridylyltransferase
MATKSFLSPDEEAEALQRFPPPAFFKPQSQGTLGVACSTWLGEVLFGKLSSVDGWREARPIALGSWARDELCPKSDIDMIFCGPQEVVQKYVGQIQARGLRLRSRVPEDDTDWTIGVQAFDILAILQGRAFDDETAVRLAEQKSHILKRGPVFARSLLEAIKAEKRARTLRYDSVANYLEPNLKFGPGGLRDLEQALAIHSLFRDRFHNSDRATGKLLHYKGVWLALRQYLHLTGGGDIISGPEQTELAKAFGFDGIQDFMREFQKGISTVNFYANWILAQAEHQKKTRELKIKTVDDALRALSKNSGVLTQAKVREYSAKLAGSGDWPAFFKVSRKEEWFEAVFDSHLIDHWLKDVTRLRGLVQHDHYHRFTADAHLLQAIKEVIRAKKKPKLIGRLAAWARKLSDKDWQVLLWTALFHDIAKGMGGDHSQKGVAIVRRELGKVGVDPAVIDEVEWMVNNHLLLSTAAFRMNVREPATWQHLHAAGAVGPRLKRLAIFTAVDIRATNPEAWSEWKERLLADLLEAMASQPASGILDLLNKAGKKLGPELAREIDPVVAAAIPATKIMDDVVRVKRAKKDLPPLVLKNRRSETWVRFHHHEDRPGLFLQFVAKLFALGCSIQQSSVRTLPKFGVYDWFQVRTTKTPAQISRQLELIKDWTKIEPPAVVLAQIEVISRHGEDVILSFRGRDQKGVLLATAKALFEFGFAIRWAKVITWGSQIDDIFCVQGGSMKFEEALALLKKRFSVPDQASSEVGKIAPPP